MLTSPSLRCPARSTLDDLFDLVCSLGVSEQIVTKSACIHPAAENALSPIVTHCLPSLTFRPSRHSPIDLPSFFPPWCTALFDLSGCFWCCFRWIPASRFADSMDGQQQHMEPGLSGNLIRPTAYYLNLTLTLDSESYGLLRLYTTRSPSLNNRGQLFLSNKKNTLTV